MNPVALDGAKLLILMAAGGLFSGVGLWLLLRPKPASGAKIELFGMKFESSSAGLLVFLIGAAFLATPLFVPERAREARATHASAAGGQANADVAAEPAAATIPQRARAEGREREPNEGYDEANQIAVGDSISVVSDRESEDWFVLPIDPTQGALHIRIRSASYYCTTMLMHLYTEDETSLPGTFFLPEENTAKTVEIPLAGSSYIFMRFTMPATELCRFELFTSYSGFK